MGDAFFERLDATTDAAGTLRTRVRATAHTNGPWEEGLQHAGPPTALLTRSVRGLSGLPPDPLPARLSVDILGPVPVADLVVTAQTLRPGRRVALAEASLATASQPERPLMSLRAWLLRQSPDPAIPGTPVPPAPALDADLPVMTRPAGWHAGYLDAIAWQWVAGSFESPGPATVWTRLRVDLVDGEPTDALDHLVAVADSASGISAVASPARLLFVNTDLTLHLTRAPRGEAVWMRAHSTLDPVGVGRADGELGDLEGTVATSAQCLFVEPRG